VYITYITNLLGKNISSNDFTTASMSEIDEQGNILILKTGIPFYENELWHRVINIRLRQYGHQFCIILAILFGQIT
jgi:hypothetical protein